MQFEIGQVWEVSWVDGGEAIPSKAVIRRRRQGVLVGIDLDGSVPTKLYFSCPMVQGRRTGEIQTREWQNLGAKLLGTMKMVPPPF